MPVPVPVGMPEGSCQCQCGGKTTPAVATNRKNRIRQGEIQRFRNGHQHQKPFWDKASGDDPDECWEWQSARFKRGYGKVKIKQELLKAHRVAWEMVHGPIPEGMCICHRCDNPPCVNANHLFLGTQRDNIADMVAKGRHSKRRQA